MSRILLDAGPSMYGWSHWGMFLRCPRMYAYRYRLGMKSGPRAPLVIGSLGHTALAHHYARLGAAQGGVLLDLPDADGGIQRGVILRDPDVLLEPIDAMQAWCEAHPEGWDYYGVTLNAVNAYLAGAKARKEPDRVVAVEMEVFAAVGKLEEYPDLGLGVWVLDPATVEASGPTGEAVALLPNGRRSRVVLPKGVSDPIFLSRRIDLVVQEGRQFWLWDHKFRARANDSSAEASYAMDGGFILFDLLGRGMYGDAFGGVRLNIVQKYPPYPVVRPAVSRVFHNSRTFASIMVDAARRMAYYRKTLDPWEWPATMHELVCVHKYGVCDLAPLCRYGKDGVVELQEGK